MLKGEAIAYGKMLREAIKGESPIRVCHGDGIEEFKQFLDVALYEMEKKSKFEWHDLVANPSDLPSLDDTYLVKYGAGSSYAYVGYDKRGWSWYETDEPFDKPVLAWTNFDTFGD